MTRGLNKVMIIGHLGRDPEMRFTSSGRAVATFSVATTRGWSNNQEGEPHQKCTEWFYVVTWDGLAELCKQRLHKGSHIYVEGYLQTRCWEKPDGQRHYRTELVAQELIFLSESSESIPSESQASEESEAEAQSPHEY